MNILAIALVIIGLSVAAVGLGVSPRGRLPLLSLPWRAAMLVFGVLLLGGGGVLASRPAVVPQQELRGGGPAGLPAPSMVPLEFVVTPELRGLTPEAAAASLASLGMTLGDARNSCRDLAAEPLSPPPPAGTIVCQAVAPGNMAAVGVTIEYVTMR